MEDGRGETWEEANSLTTLLTLLSNAVTSPTGRFPVVLDNKQSKSHFIGYSIARSWIYPIRSKPYVWNEYPYFTLKKPKDQGHTKLAQGCVHQAKSVQTH